MMLEVVPKVLEGLEQADSPDRFVDCETVDAAPVSA